MEILSKITTNEVFIEIMNETLTNLSKGDTISTNKGEPIVLDENAYAGKAFRNIAKRIVGEEVPLMDLNSSNGGFFHSIKKLFGRK